MTDIIDTIDLAILNANAKELEVEASDVLDWQAAVLEEVICGPVGNKTIQDSMQQQLTLLLKP